MNFRESVAILGLVGVVAALAVAGTAVAQTPTPTQPPGTNYHEYFLDRLANALGTTRDQLNSAFTQARNETADQAVRDGRLTQQQADAIKAQPGTAPFGFGFGHGRGGKMGGAFLGGSSVHSAIAGALGITPEELINQLRSGRTLAELAQGKEQAVKDAVVAAVKPQLDQAVQNGRMTQEQADQRLNQIQSSDLNNLVGPRGMERGRRGGNGPLNPTPGASPTPAPSGNPALGPAIWGGRAL